ncbi:MAG: endonuclease/exonuclease/phosphatase family protein [Bacteroidota bacterium]|nr:endonuclease/exonuclease/phosphatase family protein [Bacteroidota bacterium]MDP4249026.1 endonuclease/exonuclease/phosphatase family protein [Bacteroidota bacterium]
MASLRKFTKRFFILLNIAIAFLFLLTCCNAFLHPDKWWFISLLAFLFPLFLFLLLAFLFLWLFVSKKWALITLISLLVGWQNIHAFFGMSLAKKDFSHKQANTIRIMTWNVRRWDEFITKKTGASGHRLHMFELVSKQNADFLCFQEFYEPDDSSKSNIRYIRENLHFPYYFFSRDFHNRFSKYQTGVIIFSKYPILRTLRQGFSSYAMDNPESLIEADVIVQGKRIRVCTVHLQSVLFKPKDFRDVEIIRKAEDSILQASRSLAKKLKYALSLRGYQADTVRRHLDASPYPVILCGDFNDVPNSYTYFHIKGERQDAFIAKSFGIGRTYINISPTLRIDYILPAPGFKVLQSEKIPSPFSDHHPVIADLQLQDEKR